MKRPIGYPEVDMSLLISRAKIIAPIPESVRLRAMARARSTCDSLSVEPFEFARPVRFRRFAVAVAVATAFGVGVAAAAVVFRGAAPEKTHVAQSRIADKSFLVERPIAPPLNSCKPLLFCPKPTEPLGPSSNSPTHPSVESKPRRPDNTPSAQPSYAVELSLLQRAQAAYIERKFVTALLLVTEHSRRFPKGGLTEEREALRVKVLLSDGREKEANRAAKAFESRFPRSALLK